MRFTAQTDEVVGPAVVVGEQTFDLSELVRAKALQDAFGSGFPSAIPPGIGLELEFIVTRRMVNNTSVVETQFRKSRSRGLLPSIFEQNDLLAAEYETRNEREGRA